MPGFSVSFHYVLLSKEKTEWKRVPKENIADNGQFLVGGGHQGRAVECELANVRLWTRWLHIFLRAAEQLSSCFSAAAACCCVLSPGVWR